MKNLSKSWRTGTVLATLAVIVGIGIRMLHLFTPPWLFSLISLLSFAIGTIGRVGWESQTFDGKSPTEIWDRRIFLACYFVGIASGVACLPSS